MHRRAYLLLLAIASAQQVIAQSETLAAVEGRVIQDVTKEPVRKATVTLGQYADANGFELVATTDETGHFRFADVKPGVYRLMADKAGLLPGSYGAGKPQHLGSLLKINAGDHMQDLTLRLFPAGAISGQVLDHDGDPVPGRYVVLWTRRRPKDTSYSRGDQTSTDQTGEYRFDGLMPGSYLVSAGPSSSGGPAQPRQIMVDNDGKATNLHELTTFYPSALAEAEAQSIRIESGQERTGVDVRIQNGRLLSVTGTIAGALVSKSNYELTVTSDDGIGPTVEPGKVLPDGKFVFEDLPPGKHRLALIENSPNGPKEVGSTEITLADEDLTRVVIAPIKPAVVRVRVMLEGEDRPLTTGSVFLSRAGEQGADNNQFNPVNGTYVLSDVPPGTYEVGYSSRGSHYLKSVQSGGHVLDAKAIEVTEGGALDLLLTYSKNVASVSGDVEVPQDLPKNSVHVFLIEGDTATSSNGAFAAELDQTFHFAVNNLRPGKYLVFGAQEGEFEAWNNPQFVEAMRSKGSEIKLHEKEHAIIHLKLITKDITDRIRQQLGL